MSLQQQVGSDHQLARLLQIGAVLEEVVEARAGEHHATLDGSDRDPDVEAVLADAQAESAAHRRQLESLLDDLAVDPVPFDEIESLVEAQYEPETDTDGVLYDQLCSEETAYKFYDDLIAAIDGAEMTFSVDRERVLATLRGIRDEEAAGVERVTELMEVHA